MTIALIEDDDAVLDSLRLLLEGRAMPVCCFGSVEAFLAAEIHDGLACIVSDVRLPGLSGLDLQRTLKQNAQSVPLILITGHGDVPMAVAAIKHGAFDFIEKPYDAEHLIAVIEKACTTGERMRLREGQKAEIIARIAELPPRQREVMGLVAEGLSNKQIAIRLGISPRTVENYRAWVMERLGASSIADLVRKVLIVEDVDDASH
jgi:two-component system, LuxR family, response regulator FixJ